MLMALTDAAASVPAVTLRAVTVLAVRVPRLALPAVTVPVAASEPAVTAPVDAMLAAWSAPFTVIEPLITAPANEAVSAAIAPAASIVPATRTAFPTVRSPLTEIAARFQIAAQIEAFGRELAGAGNGVAAHIEIGLHPVGRREARHGQPLEPAAEDGAVIETAQRRQGAHRGRTGEGRLEGADVVIDVWVPVSRVGAPGATKPRRASPAASNSAADGGTVSPAAIVSAARTSIASVPWARISTR